jgi:hypothetical protein
MREDSDQMEPTFSEAQRDAQRADSDTNLDPEIVSDRDYDGSADTAVGADVDLDRSASEGDEPLVDADRFDADRRAEVDAGAPVNEADTTAGTGEVPTGEDADQRDELMPGGMVAAPVGDLLGTDQSNGLRSRWQELQLRFVDDPRGVVTEAQSLVAEAVQSLTTALTDQQNDLDGLASGGNGDTEQLRVALQRYREFFDRVLGYS